MAKRVQLRRGTTAQTNAFTGAIGEVTVDTDKDVLVVHDGATAGGFPAAARANADGTVSIIGKNGSVITTITTGTKIAEYFPIACPTTTPPTGYAAMVGQAINATTYPILASLYGSNLPDMRGVFIRGWDNGRGLDSGRVLLSYQLDALQNITGSLGGIRAGTLQGAFFVDGLESQSITGAGGTGFPSVGFDASRVARTASETRPKNVAFNYIVKLG